jgi:hypothetical protein
MTYGLSCSGSGGVASTVATLTVSQTNIVNANGSCAGAHAGTPADPFPFSCIVDAINGLPTGGGTVIVGDGYWSTQYASGTTYISRGNWNLVGNSLNALIAGFDPLGAKSIWLSGLSNVRISNLTWDGSSYLHYGTSALRMTGMTAFNISNNFFIGGGDGAAPAFLIEGGQNVQLVNNYIQTVPGVGADAGIQFNPGSGTSGGFLVSGNTLDTVGLYIIGVSSALIFNNATNSNTIPGNSSSIYIAPALGLGVTTDSVVVDNNTLSAPAQSVYMSGLPQDHGAIGPVQNLIFSNNRISSTFAEIAVNTFDTNCLATCNPLQTTTNTKILNNTLTSYRTGSIINIKGGANGSVNGVTVQGNVLNGPPGATNQILQDAHTYNAIITGNSL